MRKHTHTPYSNQKKWIPKDRRVPLGYVHPVDHFNVNQQDIAVAESAEGGGSTADIAEPNNPPSGVGGDGGAPGSIANLVSSITSVVVTPGSITGAEPKSSPTVLTVDVGLNRLEAAALSFQWQKKESGGSFSDISGQTSNTYSVPAGLTVGNDNGDEYRCVVSHTDAVNTPVTSNNVTISVTRNIQITDQPVLGLIVPQGSEKTFEAVATTTSGTINFQWQVKLAGSTTFSNIVGASGTVGSGTTVSYTTSAQTTSNNGDEYRVVFSGSGAADVIGASVIMTVSGADFKVSPAINGIEFWNFEQHGPLVFDPNTSSNYTLTSLEGDRSKYQTHLWGQGRCEAKGGYTQAVLPISGSQRLALRMNSGGGSAGSSDGGRYAESGGGYAGIFNNSVSRANALAIAGGAGGSCFNTASSCGGSQQNVNYTYSYSVPYQTTCDNSYYERESRSGGGGGAGYGWGDTAYVLTIPISRTYFVVFNNTMPVSNFSLSVSPSSCAGGGDSGCPGFYYSINITLTWGFVVQFYRRDNGQPSYVSSFSYYAYHQRYVQNTYPCTRYTTVQGSFNHSGTQASRGGAGGGTSAGDGRNGQSSLISARGGYGGNQSTGGTGGSTSSGGSTNGRNGGTLSGGRGGNNSGPRAAAGGGGGGGGYFGGGGGGGGYDGFNGSSSNPGRGPQSGGGGGAGSGYVHPSATGSTSGFAGSSHPNRGSAGEEQQNSRIVIEASYINLTTEPSSVVLQSGTATFTVGASVVGVSGETPSYQWEKRAVGETSFSTISGATGSSYTTPTVSVANNGDRYRCKLANPYCASKVTEEVLTLVTSTGSQTYSITNPGVTNIPIPASANNFQFWMWGAGGEGVGECPRNNFSGGGGGYITGEVPISSGQVPSTMTVFVGAAGKGSPVGQAGYGAGRGGQRSELTWNGVTAISGGGGGAGQNGNGGGGGATNTSGGGGIGGGSGTGPNNGSVGGTTGRTGGGAGGGSGLNQGNRGGGGGSGLMGGTGSGGNGNSNCSGGGGAGGSGTASSFSYSSITGTRGNTGGIDGALPVPTTLPSQHVSGHGGSNQNGLVVVSVNIPGALEILGENSGTVTDISNLSSTNTLSEPVFLTCNAKDYNITIRLRGNSPSGNGGTGAYVQGTFTAKAGQSYKLYYDTRYAAVFYGTGTNGNNCIMLAAEGGYEGVPRSDLSGGGHPARPSNTPGGNAGYPNGSIGSNLNNSYGGSGGTVSGYKSGNGGNGGAPGNSNGYSGSAGGAGGFFTAGAGGSGVDGNGGDGGFGYYGGGGGGGGWDLDYNAGGYFGGGGGGGASYIGGLPNPSTNSDSPAEVVVSSTSYGTESGSPQIQIISVAES